MTVTTVSFSFSFVFTRDLYNTHYITYFMAHSFYAFLAPPIVVGVLLTCQSLDPEKRRLCFFRCISKKKTLSYIRVNTVLQMLSQLVKHSCLNKEFHIVEMSRLCEFPAYIAA